ncbi:MAG: YggS family pyridoxal phosphate enzyme [Acidimicrobiales bacterium]
MTAAPGEFDPARFEAGLEDVRRRIDGGSADPASVTLVAVTKGFTVAAVAAALAAGLPDIGENYADELVAKAAALPAGECGGVLPTWHFLGAVQRNKVARLAPLVTWWQGLRRVEEGRAIARHRPGSTVLVQVDVAGLPGRGGCSPDEVVDLVAALRDEDLRVAGLMAVGPPGPPEAARPGFALVSRLADSLDLPVRSFGMSDDLEVALSEGSTMLRVGRALFGERVPRGTRDVVHPPPDQGTTL